MHGRVVVHCQNDYALSRVCPGQEDAACRPERGHGCPVSRVVAAHGVHGDKRRLRQRRVQQAGGRGVPSPSPGMYPASVRRYTGPMPLFSQSGFTPSFSKSVIYQAPGTDCRLLASEMLDCLISRISANAVCVRGAGYRLDAFEYFKIQGCLFHKLLQAFKDKSRLMS